MFLDRSEKTDPLSRGLVGAVVALLVGGTANSLRGVAAKVARGEEPLDFGQQKQRADVRSIRRASGGGRRPGGGSDHAGQAPHWRSQSETPRARSTILLTPSPLEERWSHQTRTRPRPLSPIAAQHAPRSGNRPAGLTARRSSPFAPTHPSPTGPGRGLLPRRPGCSASHASGAGPSRAFWSGERGRRQARGNGRALRMGWRLSRRVRLLGAGPVTFFESSAARSCRTVRPHRRGWGVRCTGMSCSPVTWCSSACTGPGSRMWGSTSGRTGSSTRLTAARTCGSTRCRGISAGG